MTNSVESVLLARLGYETDAAAYLADVRVTGVNAAVDNGDHDARARLGGERFVGQSESDRTGQRADPTG
jgi:hypothetical protein